MITDNILCGVSTLRIFRRVRSGGVSVKTAVIARLHKDGEKSGSSARIWCDLAKRAVLDHVVEVNKMMPAGIRMEAA